MNFKKYQQMCLRTMVRRNIQTDTSMLCMGLAGETGEIIDYLKKVFYHGHEFDKEKLTEEIGDLTWYLAVLLKTFDIDIDRVLNMNIEKLIKRYPAGFSIEDSIKRADTKGGN